MRLCPKCNQELDNEALFCTKCGARQEHKCATCGAELAEDSKFCIKCGKAVNNKEIPQKQNTSELCDNTSKISKNKINSNFNYPKIAIVILVIISLIGYFTIYRSNKDFVKLNLDRGVSVEIPKEWNIDRINIINSDDPQYETLLDVSHTDKDNDFNLYIISSYNMKYTPEKLKNISQTELDEESSKIITFNEFIDNEKLKYISNYCITQKDIFKYPSIFYYKIYSTSKSKNTVHYQWTVATKNQELYINLYYNLDVHSDNKFYETIIHDVLPSIKVKRKSYY